MKKTIFMMMILFAVKSFAQDGKLKVVKDTTMSMTNVAQELGEVSVVTKIQKSKMNGDVMVTRIVGTTLANSGSVEDALAKVPGLLRRNDQIEVIGKGAPIYYINGRKVQDVTELQRLSSQEIKDVEVINTPGAQYDAQVNAVVRIKTVKRHGDGLGGSFETKDLYSPSHGDNRFTGDINLNYRHNSLEVFGGANFGNYNLNGYKTDFSQETISKDDFFQKGKTELDQHYQSIRYNLGADWQISENNSVGFKVERNDNLIGKTYYSMTDDVLLNGKNYENLLSKSFTDADGLDSWAANAYYSGQKGKLGIDWNFDYYTTSQSTHAITNETDNTSSTKYIDSQGDASNDLYATKLIFTYPIGKGKIMAGTELDFVNRNNKYAINETSIADDESKVKENTYSAFAEYSTLIPKAGMLTLGLRYEHVSFDYKSFLNNEHISRENDYLFPTISFATQVKDVQASLSYSVKTRRPNYRDLRSNIEYNNRYTLSTGNPQLKNEFNHQVALNARWKFIGFSANYQCQKNGIYDWTHPYDDNGTVMINWINFDKPVHTFSAFVNLTNTYKFWTPSYTVGFQKQILSFDLDDPREATGVRTVSYNKPMFIVNANNAFKIPSRRDDGFGAWQVELNSEFLSKFHYGNAYSKNCFWNLSFAVQKCWLENDALSLRLQVNDIAHMAHHNVILDLGNYIMTQNPINGVERSVYDPQTISLSLRYKFNAVKSKYKGAGAGADMRSRM